MSGDIVTERLVLRALRADDAETMFAYRSDPEIMRYQGWDPESHRSTRATRRRSRSSSGPVFAKKRTSSRACG